MIGGGVGGFLMGILNVKNYSGGSPGFLTLPSYLGGDTLTSFYFACAGAAVSVVIAFIISYVLYKDPQDEDGETASGCLKYEGRYGRCSAYRRGRIPGNSQ